MISTGEFWFDALDGTPLPPHPNSVRRELLGRMWRFARSENDIIFNSYPPVALSPYGPLAGLRGKLGPNRKVIL
jgi:hypothetical protein